jgi:ABC-2 type transport system ATP-binding protein
MPALSVQDLHKTFGEIVAVDGISFEGAPGEIFGLLGPNGAGKSTTLNCICGLLTPTSGRVLVLDRDIVRSGADARQALGVVPQDLALYEDLDARENLEYWGGASGMRGRALRDRAAEVLEAIGLLDRASEAVKRFSGGMKRRLNFGCGIVHRPQLLLLDEPTVGVDPQSRVRLLDLVREQARRGACVVYTTHYMEEAEALCDRLAIVDRGRVIAQGTLPELRAIIGERDMLTLSGAFRPDAVRAALAGLDGLELLTATETELVMAAGAASRRLPAIFAALESAGSEIRDTNLTQPTLEGLFIKLTGKHLRE